MNPRICICCGEPMAEGGQRLSRNPNMCASCSSLVDGMAEETEMEPQPSQAPRGDVPQPDPPLQLAVTVGREAA